MPPTYPDPQAAHTRQTIHAGDAHKMVQPIVRAFRLNSIGTKLFLSLMGSALLGVGGVALVFGEIVKYQTEEQIRQTLRSKTQILDNTLSQAEIFAETVRTSILTLHLRQEDSAETYRRLMFELFKNRPDLVVGLGMGQSKNGILPQEQWFFPYYQLDVGGDAAGIQLSPPYDNIRYIDGTQPDTFYPESDRYQSYFLSQEDTWSQPDQTGGQLLITYYSQIFDDQENWLGTVFVDVENASLRNTIDDPVLNELGYFVLLNEDGKIISYPNNSINAEGIENYRSIPGLEQAWSQMQEQSGLIEGEQGYWAYERIPEEGWMVLAFVPYPAVFNQVGQITVGGTLAIGFLCGTMVFLVVRSLNRRLRPMLDECNRFAEADANTLALLQRQDEIGQLSTSFFNLLEQIKLNEEQIRQEVARTVQTQEQLKQAAVAEQENQLLQTEVEHILQVVSAIEEGNLTVEAQVSSRLTGLVADTLNRLIERLGQMMAIVMNATERVTQGAEYLEQLAVVVADNAQQQTQSLIQAQSLLKNVNDLSQDAAQQAAATRESAQLTQSAIQQGQQEITALSQGIGVLQQGTDQIAKRTQTLTNYVELAAQFAKDQKRIAAMTRVLAVNASMLANRASTQQDPEQFASITREFETVATQVNDLAAQTNQSLILLQQRTDQIQTVVSGLDHDVNAITQQVNDFTIGVNQSRQIFDTISFVSEQVAEMGQRVTQSSQAIVEASQITLQAVRGIFAIAHETSTQADITREQAQQMGQLARLLLQSVEFFKLRSEHTSLTFDLLDQSSETTVPPPHRPETIVASQPDF